MVFGDTHDTRDVRRDISNLVDFYYDIDFILHLGDIVEDGCNKDLWEKYILDTKRIQDITTYYTIGNHDVCNDNNKNFLKYTDQKSTNYSFIEKEVLFICLDLMILMLFKHYG